MIFVVDPAWNLELAKAGPLIHAAISATLARAPRAADRRKPIDVTVLLGDDVMNSELHRMGWGRSDCMAMLCFTELSVNFVIGRTRTDSTYLGGFAFARETVVRDAQTKQISVAHYLASLVIHGTLALLGYKEGDESGARLARAIGRELSSDDAAVGATSIDSPC